MRKSGYAPFSEAFSSSKVSFPWPSMPSIIPHRLRRKFRSTRSKLRSRIAPSSSITALQTSFSPADTIHSLRAHQWSFYDGQYVALVVLGIFSLSVMQTPGPLVKTVIATLLLFSLLLPITRQFFLPFLPIASWLVFLDACQFISGEYRPPIWVRVLPALENIFYGANLSNILSAHKHVVLDVLAWLPYGIAHFGAPFVCSAIMFVFGPPGTVPTFAKTFGYMNLFGVIIQILFPCSAPWYENMYGLAPANYSMPGSPAGLAAIDELFGIKLYTSTFTASPLVFGAFPSLHAGCATIEALFMIHVFPRLKPLFIIYVLWLCWATMYLSHHYAVDLVGGSLLSCFCFYYAKAKFLPRVQLDKMFRWDYDFVETGEAKEGYAYGLTDLDDDFRPNDVAEGDAWSLGSTSSYATDDRSPTIGLRSPVDDAETWEGETLASGSDGEKR